jgi:hypothetical protein
MVKARPKYSTDLYGTIYIDNIQKAVVICLIIPTIFPFDAISIIKKTRMYDIRWPPWIQHQKEMLSEWLEEWQQLFEYYRCK